MLCSSKSSARILNAAGVKHYAVRAVVQASNSNKNQSFSTTSQPRAVIDTQQYRLNVGLCVVNREGLVFAAQRVDDELKSWQMPQGGIDEGEEPCAAAVRELREETAMRSVRIVGEVDGWLHYDFPTEVRAKLHGGWQRFKGQAQKWYLLHFFGPDSEVDLDGCAHSSEPREFCAWRWAPLHELPGAVVPFKRDVYQQVADSFVPLIAELKAQGKLEHPEHQGVQGGNN